MQETSSLYKRLIADPGHWKEYTLVIGESGVLVTNQGDRITFGSKHYSAEVRGSVIQLEGTTENPLTGLTIFGKTTQNGTPTPEAPVPLVSAGDGGSVGVTVAGKNLLNVDFTERVDRGITFSPTDDGGVKVSGTTQNYPYKAIGRVFLYKGVWYFTTLNGTVLPKLSFRIINRNVNPLSIATTTENTFTPKVTGWHEFEITINPGFDGETTLYPMVEIGQTATEYEPYKGQPLTVSTPNGLPGIPVTSGGNYTDETGQQWVCDEVDFGRGVYVQRVGVKEFGGWKWTMNGTVAGNNWRFGVSTGIRSAVLTALSTHFQSAEGVVNAHAKGNGVIWYTNGYVEVVSPTHKTADEFNAWNSENRFAVYYALEYPTETPLSVEELAAYAALHTNYPNTTIFNDGGADMIVGYLLNGEGPINILVASSSADSGFRESSIISMSTQKSIFSESNPSVGNCIAGQITVDMMKPKGDIPRRARLSPYVRLTNGVEHSEWIQKGVFFIDHREYSGDENERMTVYGYDHIILAEDEFPSSTHTWPRKDIDVVRDIAIEIGTSLDRRTVQIMNKGYEINYPAGYSMREVLENIAAMYAGSFIMSDTGELLLVTMFGIPGETSYLIDSVGFAITFGGDRILV